MLLVPSDEDDELNPANDPGVSAFNVGLAAGVVLTLALKPITMTTERLRPDGMSAWGIGLLEGRWRRCTLGTGSRGFGPRSMKIKAQNPVHHPLPAAIRPLIEAYAFGDQWIFQRSRTPAAAFSTTPLSITNRSSVTTLSASAPHLTYSCLVGKHLEILGRALDVLSKRSMLKDLIVRLREITSDPSLQSELSRGIGRPFYRAPSVLYPRHCCMRKEQSRALATAIRPADAMLQTLHLKEALAQMTQSMGEPEWKTNGLALS